MMRSFRVIVAAAILVVAGCGSISGSIESSSEVISSPITSVSASSQSGGDRYRGDLRQATAAHLRAGGDAEGLRLAVAELAGKHGVSNWEADERTFRAIGAGMADAEWTDVQADAWARVLIEDERQFDWIMAGYESAK